MPVCPQCDNRPFSNKEALMQHLQSSSAWHPFCGFCDRRFVSETAYEAHMAAKHPPTFDCTTCDRKYHAQFALEDHYRGSAAHPNCARCGRGVKDAAALEEHHRTIHPRIPCTPCGGKVFYEENLEQHYLESPNHPSCNHCLRGFLDDSTYAEHVGQAHPELRCDPCNRQFEAPEAVSAHFLTSPLHPKCSQCNIGFKGEEEWTSHLQTTHEQTTSPSTPHAAPIAPEPTVSEPKDPVYSTGFTPLSPRNRFKDLILGERRVDSPDLRLQMNFSSPIKEVQPLFSPTALPRPGGIVDELWTSRDNIQVPTSKMTQKSPEKPLALTTSPVWSFNATTFGSTDRSITSFTERPSTSMRIAPTEPLLEETLPPHSPPGARSPQGHNSTTSLYSPPRLAASYYPPRGASSLDANPYSPPRAFSSMSTYSQGSISPPRSGPFDARPYSNVNPREPRLTSEFHPRLYPGSVRHAARTALRSSQSPPALSGWRSRNPQSIISYSGQNTTTRGSIDASSNHTSHNPSETTSSRTDWRDIIENNHTENGSRHEFDSNSLFSEVPTPRVDTPVHKFKMGGEQSLLPSPSDFGSLSSSTSAFREDSSPITAQETDTQPTTPSSSRALVMQAPSYKITPSSNCGSPRSPEVSSPAGLAVLPLVSPLASTPVDLTVFDIPEAHHPLPESPLVTSPVTVVLELKPPIEDLSLSLSSVSSPQSFTTSPQYAMQEDIEPATPEVEDKSWDIPLHHVDNASISGSLDREHELEHRRSVTVQTVDTDVTLVLDTSVHPEGPPSEHIPPTTVGSTFSSLPPSSMLLHCRQCQAESCDDITATMCGHVFCNRCITDAVIKTSRCPVCSTPTLLYCLFRLDLSA